MSETNRSGDEVKDEQSSKSKPTQKDATLPFNLSGILGGLGGLVTKLGELAEAGEKLSKSGEFQDASGKLRGVYGIHIKTALGDRGEQEIKVEPFGNIRPQPVGKPRGEDVREPLVDVHEEEDHVLVLVEIPGVSKENVKLDLADGRLTLFAQRGETTYQKEIVLPEGFSQDTMSWECNNGILKVRFER